MVLALPQVLHLSEADALCRGLQRLCTELLQWPLPLQREDTDGVVNASDCHEGGPLSILRHRLHREAENLVVHISLRDLIQRVALVNLEVEDLSTRERDDYLPLVRSSSDDTLLARHTPLVRTPRQQVPDACGVHLHIGVIRHELDEQGGSRGQETAIQHLFHSVANGEDEGDVNERDDDVAVELAVHGRFHCPHRIGLTRQLAHGHLCDGQAVTEHAERGSGATAAESIQLRLPLARGVKDLHVDDRRQRGHLIVKHQVLQVTRLEGHQRLGSVRMRRSTHRVLLIRADTLELIEGMVAKLRRPEEEACLKDAEAVGQRHRVEVLYLHLRNEVLIVREGDLVQVAVLTLDEEEEEILKLVRRGGDDEETFLLRHLQSPGDGADDVGVALLLVDKAILAADEHAAGAVNAAWNGDEGVRAMVHRIGKLSGHMIQPQVHLVERQHLLWRVRMRVPVHLLVAQLDGCKKGVLKPDVHAYHGVDQRVTLVRFQRRRDCQPGCRVPVEDIHELLLLNGTDHHGATLGVHS
mmetsp:Transcript_83137/g.168693  ORF Transcript_83137/g.168693 Transcript_83137/m.168693 type:complete len:526 (-) Transcript_83137:460-2037(-)